MDRTREARRVTMAAATNGGLSRRRHRSSSLRDSPEDDRPVELQETVRLRDRGSGNKDRDRERERERDRERERERERDRDRKRDTDRPYRTIKRRRADRLMSNREGGVEDSSEESVNDDEEDDDDDGGGGPSVRMLAPNAGSLSASSLNHQHQQPNHHRKSFPPPAKIIRSTPPVTTSTWKPADEMIGVSVPRKARSASTKRSHECWASSGAGVLGGEQIHRQASTSPVRPGVAGMLASPPPPPPPASPSSSNASVRKRMKPNGQKQRPVKTSSKSPSSAQDEIEIEIAEVLYGLMRQPQGPSKEVNKPSSDAKSSLSLPISNSASAIPQSSSILPPNSNSFATPLSAIAPKRKRPRPVNYEDDNPSVFPVRNNSISSTAKVETDMPAKIEATSPNLEKNSRTVTENGDDLINSQAAPALQLEPAKPENSVVPDSKPLTEESESRDVSICKKDESRSPKKESSPSPANRPTGLRLDDEREKLTVIKAKSSICESERQREEKFQIDLMAPPPSRSSPERDGEFDFDAADPKPIATNVGTEMKSAVKDVDKGVKFSKEDVNTEGEDRKRAKTIADEAESQRSIVNRERTIDLHLELEKSDRDGLAATLHANKLSQHVQKQQHQQTSTEKTVQAGSLPLPLSMASWPGGLPPMGYMAPLQGVVPLDGSTAPSAAIQPPHLFFTQPRPKRCATHCYIARNIHYHNLNHQIMKMNPFWPAAAGSASLYAAKACNLNVVPSTELPGNIPGRGVNSVQDKGQGLAMFPGNVSKDKGPQAANMVDAQRKPILLQQAIPPGAPSNILPAPAFIFQAAAAAASVGPGSVKSPPATAGTVSSTTSNSASVTGIPTGPAAGPAMSFNYPNMPGNEPQYLAILPNNSYPFIPAHVGAPPAYRGTPAQAMLFNGSFYSSQMLHPSQLQQQQQQPLTQSQQSQQGHQNGSMPGGSSSSQKHLQNQQQRPHVNIVSGGAGNVQVFPAPKTQSSQQLQPKQRQTQAALHQSRQVEGEIGSEDNPSTADSRVSRANTNIYGQNFPMPLQPPNFALMTAPSIGGPTGTGNHGEKKQPQPPLQQQGSKAGVEPFTSPAFALSFASINGTTAPGLDISSFTHNHAILQSLPEGTRQNCHQIMAAAVAAQAAQQKKNFHVSEEGKRGTNDATNVEEDRKSNVRKVSATVGQSIAFSRPDPSDASVSQIPLSTVIDSSARSMNLGSASARGSGSVVSASIGNVNVNASNSQQQLQRNQQQHQQMLQFQKQQQFAAAAAARNKTPATSNGSAYSDHLHPSSMAAKYPSTLSPFPQNLVQNSGSPAQSPQWKTSGRTTTTQVPSPSLSSSTSSSVKGLSHQGRPQQSHISFASNQKSSTAQGQPPSGTQSPSPPVMVGSPTTSSISKNAGGSPRTTGSTSTGNKGGQVSTLSSQQAKNSPSVPSRKSSPVGSRNVPSMLGNPQITSSLSTGTKPQVALQQQQQQQKHALQQQAQAQAQAQLFFSSPYMQAQAQQHSGTTTSSATAASGYYLQRHQNEQQQPPSSSTASSTPMLLRSVTLSSSNTTDPAKAAAAAAAAAGNIKGGGLPSQGLINAAQFAAVQSSGKPHQLAGFPYVSAVPAAVQVKPAEQKQPAGE